MFTVAVATGLMVATAAQAAPGDNKLVVTSKSKIVKAQAAPKKSTSALTQEQRNLQPGYVSSAKTTIDEPKMSAQSNAAFEGQNNASAAAGTTINKDGTIINENNRNSNRVINNEVSPFRQAGR